MTQKPMSKKKSTWTKEDRAKSTAIQKAKMVKAKQGFLDAFMELAGNVSALCKQVGVSRQSFYRWMKEDKAFKQDIEDKEEGLLDFAESKLMSLIEDKHIAAVIFYLKTKGKKRGYIEAQKFMHMGEEEGEPIPIQFVRMPKKKREKKEAESKG